YDGGERIHIGTEYTLANILSIRAGYRPNLDTGALTAGFGLSPHAFGINLMFDYAYSSADVAFGSINRFSLGFAF
ncbi:MAG: hypothetical protein HWN51_05240, partial [Desulfobacterales bacterium]|nr:hypothetical protein [Desulfobacterales bacterium]